MKKGEDKKGTPVSLGSSCDFVRQDLGNRTHGKKRQEGGLALLGQRWGGCLMEASSFTLDVVGNI